MINTFKMRYETNNSVQVALENLCEKYTNLTGSYECIEVSDGIQLKLLGKTIIIPYYNEIYGNWINQSEVVEKPLTPRKYDSYEYRSLTPDEVYNRIIRAFDEPGLKE